MLQPLLLPREPQRYDQLSARLQPLKETLGPSPSLLCEGPLFHPRSMRRLSLRHRKRCAPNRGERLPSPDNGRNYDASTAQSNPIPSALLPQDYAHGSRGPPHNLVQRLTRAYPLAPSLVISL